MSADTVTRARLFDALDAGAQTPLTLITGPAGTGKTTLVGSWAQARGSAEFVWVELDGAGGSREQVWGLILDALAAAGVVGLDAIPVSATEVLLAELGAALTRHEAPVTLVLDDVQEVLDPDIRDEFLQLARWRVPNLHVIAISRNESSLRIQRLLLSGSAWHVEAPELSFTAAEARTLFDTAGVVVDDARLDAILARTSGWAAGLGLAVLGLRRGNRTGGAGTDTAMSDYLFQEVIARLDVADREFLLRTSIVDSVSGLLADAITGEVGSGGRLENLRRRGFPIAASGSREWYRPHPPLVGEYLRDELRRGHGKPQIDELHRRAACWMTANGQPVEAVDHAMTAGARELAAEVVEEHFFELLLAGHLADVAPLLSVDPSGVVGMSPMIGYAVAWAALLRRDLDATDRWLALAGEATQAPPELQPRIDAARLLTLLERARIAGDIAATRTLSRDLGVALGALGRDLPQARTLGALVVANLGAEELWHGDPGVASAQVALGVSGGSEAKEIHAVAAAHAARARLRAGELAAAQTAATGVVADAERDHWSEHELVTVARTVLVGVALERSDLVDASEQLALAVRASRAAHPLIEVDLELRQAELLRRLGRPQGALAAIGRVDAALVAVGGTAHAHAAYDVQLALTLLTAGRVDEAAAAVGGPGPERAVARAVVALSRGQKGVAHDLVAPLLDAEPGGLDVAGRMTAYAIVALSTPDEAEAPALLDRALALGGAERLRSPLDLLASPALTAMLLDLRKRGTAHEAFADRLLHEGEPVPGRLVAGLADPLSVRELDVLRFLPTTLTAPEIAGRLYVSANTVKSHLKHIYVKLEVGCRRDAVMRARHEGLLPGGV